MHPSEGHDFASPFCVLVGEDSGFILDMLEQ